MIAETEEELIKRLNDWKDNVGSKGIRVNMNKTKVMISYDKKLMNEENEWDHKISVIHLQLLLEPGN